VADVAAAALDLWTTDDGRRTMDDRR
jgi:hypothetical protein